jgi:4-hydroxy-tetrahydrodipicolinate reductase
MDGWIFSPFSKGGRGDFLFFFQNGWVDFLPLFQNGWVDFLPLFQRGPGGFLGNFQMEIPLIIYGAFGRLGRSIIDLALKNQQFLIAAAIVKSESKENKKNIDTFPIYYDLESTLLKIEERPLIIDCSTAECAGPNLLTAKKYNCPILIVTTGHSDENLSLMKDVAKKIPVIYAPNTSLMASLLSMFSELSALALNNIQAAIIDIHHKKKKDAPSGTARALKKTIIDHNPGADISIHSIRQGDVVGEHTLYFFNEHERLELTHRVYDRPVFAQGALLAAQFLFNQGPGLYGMKDVLNLNLTIKNSISKKDS